MANSVAHKYIKGILKYTAHKRYVGNISGALINDFWHKISENEYDGRSYSIVTGRIDQSMLRDAFLREMSYNPMRYKIHWPVSRTVKSPEYEIVSHVKQLLNRFAVLWPNGISGDIKLRDTSCEEYSYLRDLRDCFKAIARQNMADFSRKEYRDEIVAAIAANQTLYIGADMRRTLMLMAAATSESRARHRQGLQLHYRIKSLETELRINIRHDRNYATEMTRELESLKSEYAILETKKHKTKPVTKNSVANKQTTIPAAYDEELYQNDAYDREEELMSTWTKEHSLGYTPDVFMDYVAQHTGRNR